MSTSFRVGQRVIWWKHIRRAVDSPCVAMVLEAGDKRIKLATEDPGGDAEQVVRIIRPDRIQPIGRYFLKAVRQGPAIRPPVSSWGLFTRYLEVGEDLFATRQVDVYESGDVLSYDRSHWVDEFGMLADAPLNRNRKHGPWGSWVEIGEAEFEEVWKAARASSCWQRQTSTEGMSRLGTVPVWLTPRR
jgi:hypothetical protein